MATRSKWSPLQRCATVSSTSRPKSMFPTQMSLPAMRRITMVPTPPTPCGSTTASPTQPEILAAGMLTGKNYETRDCFDKEVNVVLNFQLTAGKPSF